MLVVETETDRDFPKVVETETLTRLSLYSVPFKRYFTITVLVLSISLLLVVMDSTSKGGGVHENCNITVQI